MSPEAEIRVMVTKNQCFITPGDKPKDPRHDVRSESPPLVRSPRSASPPPEPCYAPERESGDVVTSLSIDEMSLTATSSPTPPTQSAGTGVTSLRPNDAIDARGESGTLENHSIGDGESQRQMNEEEESIALARMLMAQEAMESYALSADHLRYNQEMYSPEDLAALQAVMAEEEADVLDEEVDAAEGELSYDAMLRLGETIGDVKKERWALVAANHISKLPTYSFDPLKVKGKDENDSSVKCLVCQCAYEEAECLSRLPCEHCFHKECVDQWLSQNDFCPYCRQSILPVENSH